MKQFMEKLKKHDVIIVIILMVLICCGDVFFNNIITGDEYLLLNHTLKMYNGKMIYRDINVLTTPLLYYIGVLMFRLFGASYFTFRIYNLLITIFLYTSIYILFKKVSISKIFSILYTSTIFYFVWKGTVVYGANYNVLALAITLSGIILSIDKYVNNKQIKHYNLIQGIITFLIIFTKQNIGLYYLASNILAEIIINKKDFIKNILKQLCVTILLGSIYLTYLAFNNSLYAFIDYTILGMKEFIIKNKFLYINYFAVYILMLIYIAVFIIKTIKENNMPKTIKILIPYAIAYLLIAFPILEIFHSLIAGIPLIIIFVYCLHISLINDLKLKQSSLKFLIFTLIFLVVRTAYLMYSWSVTRIKEKDSIFRGAVYVEEEQEGINKITNYIKESKEKVIILCPEAGIYNMSLGIDNGILDLPVQGNIGQNGAKKILEILSNLKETKILLSEEKIYWQEYDEVREYVIENSEKIDEIDGAAFKYNIYILNKK